jgi:hypothetical protein
MAETLQQPSLGSMGKTLVDPPLDPFANTMLGVIRPGWESIKPI